MDEIIGVGINDIDEIEKIDTGILAEISEGKL
jgi:hypothetical protein